MHSVGKIFLTKHEVSTHEAMKRVPSLPVRHSDIDVLYVATSLKKNRIRMLKSLSIVEKMHPDDTNTLASKVVDKCKSRPDNLHSMCLVDFASSYVSKKDGDVPIKPDEMKSYIVPVSDIYYFMLNPNIIVLGMSLVKCRHYWFLQSLNSPGEHNLITFTVMCALEE